MFYLKLSVSVMPVDSKGSVWFVSKFTHTSFVHRLKLYVIICIWKQLINLLLQETLL